MEIQDRTKMEDWRYMWTAQNNPAHDLTGIKPLRNLQTLEENVRTSEGRSCGRSYARPRTLKSPDEVCNEAVRMQERLANLPGNLATSVFLLSKVNSKANLGHTNQAD